MCQFFSGVITKNKTLYDLDSDNHEDLIKKARLKDDTRNPDFVRVELSPKDGDIFNHNMNNWGIRVDQDYKPEWFSGEFAEKEMKEALKRVIDERFIINDKSWQKRRGQRIFVKNSFVVAQRNSFVEAWGNSSVVIPYSKNIEIKSINDSASVKDLSGASTDTPIIYVANKNIKLKQLKATK